MRETWSRVQDSNGCLWAKHLEPSPCPKCLDDRRSTWILLLLDHNYNIYLFSKLLLLLRNMAFVNRKLIEVELPALLRLGLCVNKHNILCSAWITYIWILHTFGHFFFLLKSSKVLKNVAIMTWKHSYPPYLRAVCVSNLTHLATIWYSSTTVVNEVNSVQLTSLVKR